MSNPDRAELVPQINKVKRHILPQDLRSPVAAARLFLSSLTILTAGAVATEAFQNFTGNNSVAQAAGPECNIRKFIVFGFEFIDNPKEPNRAGLIDPADFITGTGVEFGQANLAVLADPKNPNSKRQEFSGSMVVSGDHAEVVFKALGVTPNTKGVNGKDAAEVLVSFKDDKVRQTDNPSLPPEKAVVVECGQDGVAWGGRYATKEDITKTVNNALKIDTVGTRIDQLMEEVFGKGRKFGLTPKGDNPQQNLRMLRESIAEAIKHADAVRQKERDLAKPGSTAPATNVITPTVIITETRPISPTTGITETKSITSTQKGAEASGSITNTGIVTPTSKGPEVPGSNSPVTPAASGSIFVLSGLWEGLKFAGDLPAKAVDLITEPDTQGPVRVGINVVGWLVLLRALKRVPKFGIVGIPGAYILGAVSYPGRYPWYKLQYRRDVARAAATVPPAPVPVWTRPSLSI